MPSNLNKNVKRPRTKKLPPMYKGYMEFPLVGAETREQFNLTTRYFGDFVDPAKRYKIYKRDRQYRIELHLRLVDSEAAGWSIIDATPSHKLNKIQLAEVIHQLAVAELKNLLDMNLPINVHSSFIKVVV